MIITKLEDLVAKNVELMVGGHFFNGRIIEVDPASDTIVFAEEEEGSNLTIDVGAIQLIKVCL